MFEKASRIKLRFESAKGPLTAEDLWDLPLRAAPGKVSLDSIAIFYHNRLKNDQSISFVEEKTDGDARDLLAFDIVKHIIRIRIEERKQAETERQKREMKDKLQHILAEKREAGLRDKSVEELEEMLKGM